VHLNLSKLMGLNAKCNRDKKITNKDRYGTSLSRVCLTSTALVHGMSLFIPKPENCHKSFN
jgi:hypothetical protein